MIVSTKQILIGLAALGIGWILAGEPTTINELRGGIDRLIGRNGPVMGGGVMTIGSNGLPSLNFDHGHHHHHDSHGMPMMGGMMGGPGGGGPGGSGSDPNTQSQLQQMQQQMQQQQQQAQMQQQQQQFQDQLTQQSSAAQMQQMQQQLQQSQQTAQQQAAAAAAAAGAAGAAAPPATSAATTAAAAAPTTPGTAAQTAQSAQMTPSATAPGVIPQTPGTDPSQAGMAQQQNPYITQAQMQGQYGMPPQSPYGMPPASPYGMPAPSPYGYAPPPPPMPMYGAGTLGVPVGYGQPLGGTPMQNMFASSPNVLGGYQNVNVRGPGGSGGGYVNTVSHPVTAVPQHYGGQSSYRSHLGIVDGDQEPHHRKPFFNDEHEIINMDLGPIYPGLHGIKVLDLILSCPSQNVDEVFPRGLNKYDYGGFEEDIHVYITRILDHMEGFNPQEKVGILRDVLQTYSQSHPYNAQFYPNMFQSNPMARVPHKGANIRSGLPLANEGMVYKTEGGYMLPDKYAALQFPGTNSMPPMVHHRKGNPANQKTLFFNGQ